MSAPRDASTDPFNLQRFVDAQDAHGTFERSLAELTRGRKVTHWMWYVFPQMRGLGRSGAATHYGIQSRGEAAAYLAHPVLGPRLLQCAEAVLGVAGRSALQIFGSTDVLKLRSSATLFAQVAPADSRFEQILSRYYDGAVDDRTLALMASAE